MRVEAESDRSAFATFRARPDGSFRSPSITLPQQLTLGPQRLVIVTEDGEYGIPILIYESVVNDADGGTSSPSAAPTTRPTGGRQTSGSSGALRYVAWALVFVVAGTALVLLALRRGLRWHSMRGTGLSLGRRRPPAPEALPVPVRSSRGSRSGSNAAGATEPEVVTETDELDDFLGTR